MKTTTKTVAVEAERIEVGDDVYVVGTAWVGTVVTVEGGWVGIQQDDGRIDEVQLARVRLY